jgi:uncharacterized RDD family membrane protein YckC
MNKIPTLGHRLGSMFLDHVIICFVVGLPLTVIGFILRLFEIRQPFEAHPLETGAFYFMMLIYLNKDFIGSRSVAKRLLGLIVVDNKTGLPANELKCFLRNLSIVLWPLEVLITLISPDRRIGDFIANTRVEKENRQNTEAILNDIKKIKMTSGGIMTLIISIPVLMAFWYLTLFIF